ncbi:GNAT family N-acetyltransferase [Duganella sp. FT80W]|uniref:GNAT family N-acetyltransferase n=1 Tax=Duganella guangzhouensis TaxID=2666084 RepID=A0A6I2L8G4_9BURK|nr:GNAT family N-acetyltransferase [Duganella guangzhouensis]MRW92569.1 GNAT family N-acetyltransferase [Duganella guangzhouensis]
MERKPQLDHIFWHALNGAHRRYSDGTDQARRYTQGFSPIIAFADPARPDFGALAPWVTPGEHFYCENWTGAAPPGWRIDAETTMYRMLWDGVAPAADPAPDALPLQAHHAAAALELATLCKPGPFGIRTIELGDYFGYFDGERLMAMAGERLRAPGLCEISGVCTHPDYQGRGLAKRLIAKLLHRHQQRGDRSFLHVMRSNPAHQLYLNMGFKDYLETTVRVVVAE